MDPAKAQAVCAAYGIVDPDRIITYTGNAVYTNATGDALLKWRGSLLPAVENDDAGAAVPNHNAQYGRLNQLSGVINNNNNPGNNPDERARWLARFNILFGKTFVRPLFNNIGCTLADVEVMITEIYAIRHNQSAFLYKFATTVPDAHIKLLQLRRACALVGAATVAYDLIQFFHQNEYDFAHLTEAAITQIQRLRLVSPPNAAFPGFAAWGPGDAGQAGTLPERVARNQQGHFLKHVLYVGPAADDFWTDELRRWWQRLDIRLTRQQAQNHLGARWASVQALFGQNQDSVLPADQVVTFLNTLRGNGGMPQPLIDHLVNGHMNNYIAAAVTWGNALANTMVWVPPGMAAAQVFVSGRVVTPHGDIYVIGRLEGQDLGISSCYFAQNINNKLGARDQIWAFL